MRGYIVALILLMYAGTIQCLQPSFDIDCLVIDSYFSGEDDGNEWVGRDFESDVYDHMRDPNIQFPFEENGE